MTIDDRLTLDRFDKASTFSYIGRHANELRFLISTPTDDMMV
jgi:hypothetical protein